MSRTLCQQIKFLSVSKCSTIPHKVFWPLPTHTFSLSTQEIGNKYLGAETVSRSWLWLHVSSAPSDHHRRKLQDLLHERGLQVLCGEPLHLCSLQAGRGVHLWLCHQSVLHWHRQSVSGPHAPTLPWCVQTWLLHHQLLPGLHHWLPVSGAREQSSGGQVLWRT